MNAIHTVMKWSTRSDIRLSGALLRDELIQRFRSALTRRSGEKVVSIRRHDGVSMPSFLSASLLNEPVQIYFIDKTYAMNTGAPISQAIREALSLMPDGQGADLDRFLENEGKVAVLALQLLDAAIPNIQDGSAEPRIEVIGTESHFQIGLRIAQGRSSILVTPGTFLVDTLNFTTSEPIQHPGSWFQIPQSEIADELLN